MKIEIAKTEIIHFVGIGGIGMSGLALIMKGKGFKVQGSDISKNKNIDKIYQIWHRYGIMALQAFDEELEREIWNDAMQEIKPLMTA